MKKKIDLENWKRRDHYLLFKEFDDPSFGIVTQVDCSLAYKKSKKNKISFFLYYLFQSLKAINEIEEFGYRIINNEIYSFDNIGGSTTVKRDDKTFGFSYFNYFSEIDKFTSKAKLEIERVKNNKDLTPAVNNENVIHYTVFPWAHFTGIKHPTLHKINSIPKIAFGKTFKENEKLKMTVAVNANHSLMDGYHIAEFLDKFQNNLNS